ncbi:MAG: hypothetical protein K8T10_21940 [Candidatus Eremiobacteraeota bacterium]|nr:hypothetical protein [Candidatus Eremiobacteraeota bacterium]
MKEIDPEKQEVQGAEIDMSSSISDSIDTDNLSLLMESLREYDRSRTSSHGDEEKECSDKILQATCLTLIAASPELGVDFQASPLLDMIRSGLQDIDPGDFPEAHICHLWISCVEGKENPDIVDRFSSPAKEPLWHPIQSLLYRALAYFGKRDVLAEILPEEGALSLAQGDAWLEAAHIGDIDERWIDRVTVGENSVLQSNLCDRWISLLKAETAVARGDISKETEDELAKLTSLDSTNPPRTYEEAETRRISARASSAINRIRIARWHDNEDIINSPAGMLIPTWEREYLQGLSRWQFDDYETATSLLRSALELNPHQTPVRLALGALMAPDSPDEALKILECESPTYEITISRAGLLARTGRFDEAEKALARCNAKPPPGNEPARHSWIRGRKQYRKREYILRTALSEYRGEWENADKNWRSACDRDIYPALQKARQFFADRRRMKSLPQGRSWNRSQLKHRLRRIRHEIGDIPLTGDALFFRGAAMMDVDSRRTVKDFRALLRRRSKVRRELKAGGRRIIFIGDAFLKLGMVNDAIQAYKLLESDLPGEARERIAVASVLAAIQSNSGPDTIRVAAKKAGEVIPSDPLPQLLAILGLLIAGDVDSAKSLMEAMEESEKEKETCDCLRFICNAMSGERSAPFDGMAGLQIPEDVRRIIQFLRGVGTDRHRIRAFIREQGREWVALCPTDPYMTARKLMTSLCDECEWDEVKELTDQLVGLEEKWSMELVVFVRILYALSFTFQRELREAERELVKLENLLRSYEE